MRSRAFKTRGGALVALLAGSTAALAGPLTDLGTVGPVVSTESYFQLFRERAGPPGLPDLGEALAQAEEVLKGYRTYHAGRLPVHTANMTPGDVPSRSVKIPLLRAPVCLVGADALSLEWLASYQSKLLELGATCIVVEVADEAELEPLVEALGAIPWFAASGADIAATHNLSHYPVLISREYIEQ